MSETRTTEKWRTNIFFNKWCVAKQSHAPFLFKCLVYCPPVTWDLSFSLVPAHSYTNCVLRFARVCMCQFHRLFLIWNWWFCWSATVSHWTLHPTAATLSDRSVCAVFCSDIRLLLQFYARGADIFGYGTKTAHFLPVVFPCSPETRRQYVRFLSHAATETVWI